LRETDVLASIDLAREVANWPESYTAFAVPFGWPQEAPSIRITMQIHTIARNRVFIACHLSRADRPVVLHTRGLLGWFPIS
jgi:hypothetical protein